MFANVFGLYFSSGKVKTNNYLNTKLTKRTLTFRFYQNRYLIKPLLCVVFKT